MNENGSIATTKERSGVIGFLTRSIFAYSRTVSVRSASTWRVATLPCKIASFSPRRTSLRPMRHPVAHFIFTVTPRMSELC